MRITFHKAKRIETLHRRGLDFLDANLVIDGTSITLEDDRRDYGEVRRQTFGLLRDALVMVVWTERAGARHVISMRRCNARERHWFGRQLG